MDEEPDYKGMATASLALGLLFWIPLLNIALCSLAAFLGIKATIGLLRSKKTRKRYIIMALTGAAVGVITVLFTVVFYFLKLKF